jgi:hypothetical protein
MLKSKIQIDKLFDSPRLAGSRDLADYTFNQNRQPLDQFFNIVTLPVLFEEYREEVTKFIKGV